MPNPRFTMTYQITTEESASHGDFAEHGFYEPYGWYYPLEEGKGSEPAFVDLRRALDDLGGLEPNDSNYLDARWWSEIDGTPNYRTGAVVYKSVHLPRNITESSRRRVNRLIKSMQR